VINIVVLISGSGSNLQAIMDACQSGMITGRVVGVLSNKADAYGLVRAQHAGIATTVINHKDFANREAFDVAMQQHIDVWQPDVVVLAGFMRILTPAFVQYFEGKLVNIHPSLLPVYKGLHTHKRVLASGDKRHGCSVHFVNHELDGGAVIAQAVFDVLPQDNEQTLTERVHQYEHLLYPQVLSWLANGRLRYQQGTPVLDGQVLGRAVRLLF
jgi:phosphoribosylglycinamide formyltransferase-1